MSYTGASAYYKVVVIQLSLFKNFLLYSLCIKHECPRLITFPNTKKRIENMSRSAVWKCGQTRCFMFDVLLQLDSCGVFVLHFDFTSTNVYYLS